MAIGSVERSVSSPNETVGKGFGDTCFDGTHMSHEARLFKTRAEDALEDGVHAAKRAFKSVQRQVEAIDDLKDEALHRVKRHPALAVGICFGVGCVVGAAIGAVGALAARRARPEWTP